MLMKKHLIALFAADDKRVTLNPDLRLQPSNTFSREGCLWHANHVIFLWMQSNIHSSANASNPHPIVSWLREISFGSLNINKRDYRTRIHTCKATMSFRRREQVEWRDVLVVGAARVDHTRISLDFASTNCVWWFSIYCLLIVSVVKICWLLFVAPWSTEKRLVTLGTCSQVTLNLDSSTYIWPLCFWYDPPWSPPRSGVGSPRRGWVSLPVAAAAAPPLAGLHSSVSGRSGSLASEAICSPDPAVSAAP